MFLSSLESRDRPDAAYLLGGEFEPITRLDLVERNAIKDIKVDNRSDTAPALLQLDSYFAVGAIDLRNKANKYLLGKDVRDQATRQDKRQKRSEGTASDRNVSQGSCNLSRAKLIGRMMQ